jgi:hypothetical protein
MAPAPSVTRPVAVQLLIGIAFIDFLSLPHGFRLVPYLGVQLLMGMGMALAGAFALLADTRAFAWWYALAQGALNLIGFFVSRIMGLPLTRHSVAGNWLETPALALAFCGAALALLSGWVLYARHFAAHHRTDPVTAAHHRASDYFL